MLGFNLIDDSSGIYEDGRLFEDGLSVGDLMVQSHNPEHFQGVSLTVLFVSEEVHAHVSLPESLQLVFFVGPVRIKLLQVLRIKLDHVTRG